MPVTSESKSETVAPTPSIENDKPFLKGVDPVNEFLIDGRVYNISEFRKRHPGGGVINFFAGKDASEVFATFHDRSVKPSKILKTLPSRPYEGNFVEEKSELIKDFNKLRQDFINEGMFEPSYIHVAYRLIEVISMYLFSMYLIMNGWYWTGVILMGITQGRFGYIQHETGHYSMTGNITIDRAIEYIFFGCGIGMSCRYWRNMHNRHHAAPQKMKHDVDLETLPLLAFNKEIAKNGKEGVLKYQAYTFLPGTIITVLLWGYYLHPRYIFRSKKYDEIPGMLVNHFLRLYVGKDMTWGWMFATYFLIQAVNAVYLFGNFALNHTHKPVLPADKHVDWVTGTANHTINISPEMWCNWWMGYLNWQIEHHLFPSMPQFRNQYIAPRVKALFEKHGLHYDCRSYTQAVIDTFTNLHVVGNTVKNPKKNE